MAKVAKAASKPGLGGDDDGAAAGQPRRVAIVFEQ
jgi:hypothetical protein